MLPVYPADKVFLTKTAPKNSRNMREAYKSTWAEPLPADEIARQQGVRSRLNAGMEVNLRGLGRFIYSGLWDTMHAFYPAATDSLPDAAATGALSRYVKRDLRGRRYLQLPYTVLADYVQFPD